MGWKKWKESDKSKCFIHLDFGGKTRENIHRLNKSIAIYTIVHYSMQNNRQQPQKLNKEKEREIETK